ncbi:hypothetical protein EPH95_04010 [Salicibibacter halophilus]|uniref:Uncharacterized protein n=1 Tax=Salicibibacter halophilus TaxID=2502791 RepID=A0A514LF15_9BACI|nr:hypothetical protein [Salicibibacter halophilus]QDI90448.1 hypothetical protein EPH95_04010 [Salicibibacter halophilus]
MLSNKDIRKEILKNNLIIHPLNMNHIKGSTINLTASKFAWNISNKKSATCKNKDTIQIPPGKTVCILTEESIAISHKIAGTFHSRVSFVTKGLATYATTLDPEWFGYPLISVTNHSDEKKYIEVGESFVSLILYYLKKPATKGSKESNSLRYDLIKDFEDQKEQKELKELQKQSYRSLLNKAKKDPDYEELYNEKPLSLKRMNLISKHPLISVFIAFILGLLAARVF